MSERALVGNAADVKQVRKAKQYEKQREDRRKANLEASLRAPFSRATLGDILDDLGLYDDFYSPGNSEGTNRFLGRRAVGLKLFAQIEAIEPGAYSKMRSERQADEEVYATPKPEDGKQQTAETEESES